jgi:hypothetical protein
MSSGIIIITALLALEIPTTKAEVAMVDSIVLPMDTVAAITITTTFFEKERYELFLIFCHFQLNCIYYNKFKQSLMTLF